MTCYYMLIFLVFVIKNNIIFYITDESNTDYKSVNKTALTVTKATIH